MRKSIFTQAGGDVTITDRLNESALFKAAIGGHVRCVQLLLQTNSQPDYINAENRKGVSVCAAAIEGNCVEILKALVAKGVRLLGNHLMTALEKTSIDMLECVIYLGAPLNETDLRKGSSPLIEAVRQNNTEAIESLLQYGADINKQTRDGHTALMTAIQRCHTDVIKTVDLLIKRGSNIGLVNIFGRNALMFAVALNLDSRHRLNREEIRMDYASLVKTVRKLVSMLLDEGIGVGRCDANGNYALDIANLGRNYPDEEVLKLLFVAGASASQQPPKGLNTLSECEVPPLQNACRDVIRDQLMLNNIDSNLFKIVPKLHLPVPLLSFLLYDTELSL